MQRHNVYLLALMVGLCNSPDTARAQNDPPQHKTYSVSPAAPVTKIYGNTVSLMPDALARLRRQLTTIGTQGGTPRIVYPVIVIMPVVQDSTVLPQSTIRALPQAAFGGQLTREDLIRVGDYLARRFDRRLYDLDKRLNSLQHDLDRRPEERQELLDEHPEERHDVLYVRPDSINEDSLAALAEMNVIQVEVALLETGLFRTTDIIFEFDRSTLLQVSEKVLNIVGDILVRHPDVYLEVAGHTDSTGPETYNQRLSEARAYAVRDYLLGHFEIAPERVEVNGYGETRPLESNTTQTGRTLNRRVEFHVVNPAIDEQR